MIITTSILYGSMQIICSETVDDVHVQYYLDKLRIGEDSLDENIVDATSEWSNTLTDAVNAILKSNE